MSQKVKDGLQIVSVSIAIVASVAGLIGAFFILPYRIDAAEFQIRELNEQRRTDHELLARIEERLIAVQSELRRK